MSTLVFAVPLALLLADPASPLGQPEAQGLEPSSSTIELSQQAGAEPKPEQEVVTAADLDAQRGGESVVVGNQTLTGITSGNVLNGNYTAGSVTLSDSAFANFNGLGNLAINTGAQVSLQSGMSVVINIAP